MASNHPATEEIISKVVTESQVKNKGEKEEFLESNLSGRVLFADEIKEISNNLTEMQDIFVNNLRTVLSTIYTGSADLNIIWESPDCYVIGDKESILMSGLESHTDFEITDVILDVHSITANKKLNTHPDRNVSQGQPWVISKPANWSKSEWTIDTYLTTLVKAGLSPTQALDYWMVEWREKHIPHWANIRGTSSQAIRENIKKAEEKIESYDSSESYSPEEYFERTYHGKIIDESTTEVTVDGGYLPPRRDLFCHSRSGRLTWGYSGAGPTQLAVAILSDVLDENKITHDMAISFRDHLNKQISENDEWKYSEQKVYEWYDEFDSSESE
jgi:hypothetical protein